MAENATFKTTAQIGAALQGYDPTALPAEAVTQFLAALVMPVSDSETLPLFEALGRVLADDLISPIDVPPHDNSAMDGYAFDGAQLASAGDTLALKVVGTALAGKAWQGRVGAGECVKIMTGAVMPAGLDTVVPQELVHDVTLADAAHDASISFPAQAIQPGDNRRLRGEDIAKGQAALKRGQRLTPARLGLAASLGLPQLRCLRRLRVAYFSTGDEILSLGEAPREGAVYDSNRYTVFGLLSRMGCEVIDLGVVKDEPAALEAAFTEAGHKADAVITSGGVSVGEADFTKAMMRKLGDVAFWRVAMRPGRPMAVGRLGSGQNHASREAGSGSQTGAVLFGLPGNPVAVMVTFLAFVRPALEQMAGCTDPTPPLLQAHSQEKLRKKPGRTEYQRGWVSRTADGRLQVRTTGNQGSGVLSSMVEANGLIVLHHAQGSAEVGDLVDVMMFDGVI